MSNGQVNGNCIGTYVNMECTNLVEYFVQVMLMLTLQLHDQPINLHSTMDTVLIFQIQFQFLVQLHIEIEVFVMLALPMITSVPAIQEAMELYVFF